MPKNLIAVIVAAGAALLLVTGVVAGILISNGSDEDDRETAQAEATASLTATIFAPTTTPVPNVNPTPNDVQALLLQVPPALRQRLQQQLNDGTLTRDQLAQIVQQQASGARLGVISKVESGSLEAEMLSGEDFKVALTARTEYRRGSQVIAVTDLKVGETVLVISMDGGATAFSVNDYGVLATP